MFRSSQTVLAWAARGSRLVLPTAILALSSAYANVCTPASVPANGPFPAVSTGLQYIDSGSVRLIWTTDASPSNPVTSIQIVYATAAEWAANPGVYPHTQGIAGGAGGGLPSGGIQDSTTQLTGILSNLLPNATYHVSGDAAFTTGGNCSKTDASFATLPAYTFTAAQQPVKVNVTQPAMTGTHFTYGSNCGTTAGSSTTTITANWQDCLNQAGASPGSDISAAPGNYNVFKLFFPSNPAWQRVTCSTSTNFCTQVSGTPPSSGNVIFHTPPSPVNPGVPYQIINVTGSTFQISTDGSTPQVFANIGGTGGTGTDVYYLPWPLAQSAYITIHPSGYGTSVLPPAGVRLGPDAIAQYQPNMITFTFMEPTYSNGSLVWGRSDGQGGTSLALAAGWWFQNVAFATDPSVATVGSGLDPIGWRTPMQLGSDYSSTSIVLNQCALLFALPPSRSGYVSVGGSNIAFINSYQQGLEWWEPHLSIQPYGTNITNTSSAVTFPAMTASWVVAGGPIGTKHSCVNSGGTYTVTSGTTATGAIMWIRPSDCQLIVQTIAGNTVTTSGQVTAINGVTAPTVTQVGTAGSTTYSYLVTAVDGSGNEITGSGATYLAGLATAVTTTTTGNATLSGSNYNHLTWPAYSGASSYNIYRYDRTAWAGNSVTNSYNDQGALQTFTEPAFPSYAYTSPTGTLVNSATSVFVMGFWNISGSGVVSNLNIASGPGLSQQPGSNNSQQQPGDGFYSDGPGPYLWDNNTEVCGSVCGFFLADDSTDNTTPCSVTGAPCPIQHNNGDLTETRSSIGTNPCYFYDAACWNGGNYYFRNLSEMKQGARVLQDGNIYGPFYPQIGQGQCTLHETYNGGGLSTDNWIETGYPAYTSSNDWTFTNNTCSASGFGFATGFRNIRTGVPIKNYVIRNNVFLGNSYANTPVNQPYNSARVYNENADGNCPNGAITSWAGSGQNMILDHNTVWAQGGCLAVTFGMGADIESGVTYTNNIFNLVTDPGSFAPLKGSLYQPYQVTDTCWNTQGAILLACYTGMVYAGNVAVFTYTNSMPGSSVEFATSDITALQAGSSAIPTSTYIPTGNTLAARLANTGWFNACTLTSAAGCVNNLRLLNSSAYISGGHLSTDGLDIGANADQLEQHQGRVSNLRAIGSTNTSTTISLYAPDSTACSIDWGTTAFYAGSGTWTRVSGSGGDRSQNVSLTGLPAHGLIYYRANCQVQQPTGILALP